MILFQGDLIKALATALLGKTSSKSSALPFLAGARQESSLTIHIVLEGI